MHKFLYALRNLPALIRSYLLILGSSIGGFFGAVSFIGKTRVKVIRASGEVIDFGLVSARKVTKVGVQKLVLAWQNGSFTLQNFKYHGCGTGAVAEANTDTALGAESTAILNPPSTRATGTQTVQGTDSNILQSVGTLTFQGAGGAITEHGVYDQSATGGGNLWDRSVFAPINVAAGDSIQFTYQLTVNYEA